MTEDKSRVRHGQGFRFLFVSTSFPRFIYLLAQVSQTKTLPCQLGIDWDYKTKLSCTFLWNLDRRPWLWIQESSESYVGSAIFTNLTSSPVRNCVGRLSTNMSLEIKTRRLIWLGLILSMPNERISKVSLRWTPTTWRRWLESISRRNWKRCSGSLVGKAEANAQDRVQWWDMITALYPNRDEEYN